jgi:hypothetical protein
MDVINFDALVAQGKILLANQVDPNEDYFIIGKRNNTYSTNSFKATDYPIWAIKAKDVVNTDQDVAFYEHDLTTGGVINVNTRRGVIELLNFDVYTVAPSLGNPAIININNTTMDYSNADNVYLQLTPYYRPTGDDTFIPYLLPSGYAGGSDISIYNLSPAPAGADQQTGLFYLYYETFNF